MRFQGVYALKQIRRSRGLSPALSQKLQKIIGTAKKGRDRGKLKTHATTGCLARVFTFTFVNQA